MPPKGIKNHWLGFLYVDFKFRCVCDLSFMGYAIFQCLFYFKSNTTSQKVIIAMAVTTFIFYCVIFLYFGF